MRSAPLVRLVLPAAWLGGATLFATVVAPAAFAVLPDRALAGALVGRVLPVLFISGILLGALGAMSAWRAAGHGWRRLVLPLLLLVASATAQFGVGPRIQSLRVAIGPSIAAVAPDDPRRLAFGRLHGISVVLLGVGMLAVAASIALSARSLTPPSPRDA